MFPTVMSNSIYISDEAYCPRLQGFNTLNPMVQNNTKKKRNLPGNPDPDAEVIALSPRTLLATNRFVCEICNKGFQRDQNLQLHRRGHNLPWKLKQRNSNEQKKKRAYVCPEPTCVHHLPSRALGDLTGIKKHYCRKHCEKKWRCEKCSRVYAVQSDWKAHSKTCGTREYTCHHCGTLFSRKDSFISHKAYCDALAEKSARQQSAASSQYSILPPNTNTITHQNPPPPPPSFHPFSPHNRPHLPNPWLPQLQKYHNPNPNPHPQNQVRVKHEDLSTPTSPPLMMTPSQLGNIHISGAAFQPLSASAILQKAASVGSTTAHVDMHAWQKSDHNFTRDFLGLAPAGEQCNGEGSSRGHVRDLLSYTGGVEYPPYDRDDHDFLLKNQGYGFAETACWKNWGNC